MAMEDNKIYGSKNRRELYESLSKDGFDLGTFEDFDHNMNDENVRKSIHEAAVGAGWDLPDYDQFDRDMAVRRLKIGGQSQEVDHATYDDFMKRHPSGSNKKPDTPQPMLDAVTKENAGGYQPTAEDMAGFMGTIRNAGAVASGSLQKFDDKAENLKKRQGLSVPTRINVGESNNLIQGNKKLNPDTGKLEDTYITASGEQYDNKTLADEEQRQIDKNLRDQRYIESLR